MSALHYFTKYIYDSEKSVRYLFYTVDVSAIVIAFVKFQPLNILLLNAVAQVSNIVTVHSECQRYAYFSKYIYIVAKSQRCSYCTE